MRQKLTLLLLMALFAVGGVNAKTKTTTLWEDTYSENIGIEGSSLSAGTITVYMTWKGTEGCHLNVWYCVGSNWAQTDLSTNAAREMWQNKGTESYSFTISDSEVSTITSSAATKLFFNTAAADKMVISKITLSTEVTASSTTTLWSGSVSFDSWKNKITSDIASTSAAKVGDVIQITYSSATSGTSNIWVCKSNGEAEITDNSGNKWAQSTATAESGTMEYEITDASILESVQSGIMLKGNAATVTAVSLLTYSDSYDAVPVTIGSDGIATFSSDKNLDFSATGVTPYYVSAVATGKVTLTPATNATTWNYCGYILQGAEGTYDVPVTASATYPSTKYLIAQVGEGIVKASESGDTKFRYIFSKHNNEIGFYRLTTDDHTLGAHKAYLETDTDITPTGTNAARLAIIFDDGQTTSINSAQERKVEDGIYYNLSGQRVQNPSKGLYIVNGKKVFVK